MESNNNSFENLLKDKLSNYELPYEHGDWVKLEKDLPKMGGGNAGKVSGTALKIASVIGIIAITFVALFYFVNHNNAGNKFILSSQLASSQKNIPVEQNKVGPVISTQTAKCDHKVIVKKDVTQKQAESEATDVEINKQSLSTIISQNTPKDELKNIVKSESNVSLKLNPKQQVPNVMFTVDVTEGCEPLKITFIPSMRCDSMEYLWDFGNGETSTLLKPIYIYDADGSYIPKLTVKYKKSKQVSTFTLEQPVVVKSAPITDFVVENLLGIYIFTNRTVGCANVKWIFANGEESTEEVVKQAFKLNGTYNVTLIATGFNGCSTNLNKEIKVDVFAAIHFPNAFSPDGDGRNDYFGPIGENLSDYQFEMAIYNRIGQVLFETKDAKLQWNGKVKGSEKIADSGVYAYEAVFKDKYGNSTRKTGSVSLVKTK